MIALFVVDANAPWPREVPGVAVVSARDYLNQPEYAPPRKFAVFNLCRSYKYQSVGYYVSLLAAARQHRAMPSVGTMQDLRQRSVIRILSADLDALLQKALAPLRSDEFTLSIYFGRNLAKKYDRIARTLFGMFPAPLLRATFRRERDRWRLATLRPIGTHDVPDSHRPFVLESAAKHFEGRPPAKRRRRRPYDLAILVNPDEAEPPSDEKALARFERAAHAVGFETERLRPTDLGRVGEFDALFIRETTRVNHHTYRFARRAAAEGLVVIDDPDSILRAANKVFLAEALQRAGIAAPKTVVVHRDNLDDVGRQLGFPCILKLPDSAFSLGVVRCDDEDTFRERVGEFFEESELLVAQEFLPTDFDWRVGVLDKKVLYVSRYYMARKHWQIIRRDSTGRVSRYGRADCPSLDDVPKDVLRAALRAAAIIGDGLYGVDLKQKGRRCYVIEVNDNPSIDSGFEDKRLGTELYRRVMQVLFDRVDRFKKEAHSR